MKNTVKVKYIIPLIAILFIFVVIILYKNKNSGDFTSKSIIKDTNNDVHPNTNQDVLDEAQKEKNNKIIRLLKIALSEMKDKKEIENENNGENQNIKKNLKDDPRNIKLKTLIEKAAGEFGDLPQYVWDPVKFTSREIEDYTTNLEKILLYSQRVKMNVYPVEDKMILKNLVSGVIKDKIEYFSSACTDVWRKSLARNEDDQKTIDNNYKGCNEVVKQLEDDLNYYEYEY